MKIQTIACLILLLSVISCSRSSDSGTFSGFFKKLSRANNFQEAKKFYSAKTVSLLEDAVSGGLISDKQIIRILPLFDSKTRWEEKDIEMQGDKAAVSILYTAHPVENMIGYEMIFHLIREGGAWKIDFSGDIKKALDLGRKSDGKKYLKGIGLQ